MGHIRQETCLVRGVGGGGEPHIPRQGSVPAPCCSLGGQWVVVTFAALAFAAKYKGSGQKQERRGHQEQEPKSSKNSHDLEEGHQRVEVRRDSL
jgi:hypothetical protein